MVKYKNLWWIRLAVVGKEVKVHIVLSVSATENIWNDGEMDMTKLKSNIHNGTNGLDYILVGDYYIPAIESTSRHRAATASSLGRWSPLRAWLRNWSTGHSGSGSRLWTISMIVRRKSFYRNWFILCKQRHRASLSEKLGVWLYAQFVVNLYFPLPCPETGSMKCNSLSLIKNFPADEDAISNICMISARPKTPS